MPTYEYECDACEYSFEHYQSMMDKKLKKCPQCGKIKLHRLIGAGSGIIFKGSGFYETDFKNKKKPECELSANGACKPSESNTSCPKSESTKDGSSS